VQVSGKQAAKALKLDSGLFTAEAKAPMLRQFPGTSQYFADAEKERRRRRFLSANYQFNRRVQHLETVWK